MSNSKYEIVDGYKVMKTVDINLGERSTKTLKHISAILDTKDVPINHLAGCVFRLFRNQLHKCTEEELDELHEYITQPLKH